MRNGPLEGDTSMASVTDFLKEKSGLADAAQSLQSAKESAEAAVASTPPDVPDEPAPPADLKHAIAGGLEKVNQGAQAINYAAEALSSATSLLGVVADPGDAIANALGD